MLLNALVMVTAKLLSLFSNYLGPPDMRWAAATAVDFMTQLAAGLAGVVSKGSAAHELVQVSPTVQKSNYS